MLYLIPTPIGNLEDITIRAKRLLFEIETIICEDPREASKLFKLLDIQNKKKFIQYIKNHQYNKIEIESILKKAKKEDFNIVLISDAGMPGISDPGIEVVTFAQKIDLEYSVLPGPEAIIPSVVASGLVSKEFTFLGFLPIKKGRKSAWQNIQESKYPIVLYESIHRLAKFINEAKSNLESERKIFFYREISKKFEQKWLGKISDLSEQNIKLKGEFVIVVESKSC